MFIPKRNARYYIAATRFVNATRILLPSRKLEGIMAWGGICPPLACCKAKLSSEPRRSASRPRPAPRWDDPCTRAAGFVP